MEFKKPNRPNRGQPIPKPPQPHAPASIDSRPATIGKPPVRPVASAVSTPKQRWRLRLPKRARFILLGVAVVVLVIAVGSLIRTNIERAANSPQYQTLIPEDKTADDLGGWKRISPPENDPVFAYTDKIDGVPISVSEQPLPKAFLRDIEGQVGELAKRFNASTKLSVGGTTVYIGTSTKGPQSVIFSKKSLLVLIKSEKTIKDTSWTNYVSSLQ